MNKKMVTIESNDALGFDEKHAQNTLMTKSEILQEIADVMLIDVMETFDHIDDDQSLEITIDIKVDGKKIRI